MMRARLATRTRELLGGSATALALKLVGAGIAFAFDVLLARTVGAAGAGLYFLALSVASVSSVVGRVGLDNTLLRFTAGSVAVSDWASVAGVYRKGIGLAAIGSLAVAGTAFLLAPWLASSLFGKPDVATPIRLMCAAVPALSLLVLHGELLKGLHRILESQLVQAVGVPAVSFVALLVLAPRLGVTGAVSAYVTATFVTVCVGIWLWRRSTPKLREAQPRFPGRTLLASCFPLLAVALMHLATRWAGTVLLGVWSTSAQVGIFTTAFRTSLLIGFALFAVDTIASPKFAALHRKGDTDGLAQTARQAAILMAALASPVIVLFLAAPGWVMSLFGPEFREGGTVLVILAVGQFLNVLTGPASALLMMSGHESTLRNTTGVGALAYVGLAAVLIPSLDMVGAAVAWTLSLAVREGLGALFVYRKLAVLCLPIPGRAPTGAAGG